MHFYKSFVFFLLCCTFCYPFKLQAQETSACASLDDKKADRYFKQAVQEFNNKNYAAFETSIDKVIDIAPDYADSYLLKARAALNRKNADGMLENYEKLTDVCPDYLAEPYLQLGSYYYSVKDYEKAIPALEKLLTFKTLKPEEITSAESRLRIAKFRKEAIENPVPFEPKSVPGICTEEDEYLPIISPDNEFAFFTRRFKRTSKNSLTDRLVEEFTYSRAVNGQFDKGEKMQAPFNTNNNEGGATVTIDNQDLYFTICRPEVKGINCDIYHSQFKNNTWSPITNMGKLVNDVLQWDSQPSISSDGNTLYFSSLRDGGLGGHDIYKCEKDSTGRWGEPINLGPEINTAGNEKSPFIHTDSKTLYYSSDSLTGMGGYDIFLSKMTGDHWKTPKNIGYPINSDSDDLGFFVSTDGKTGYFASNKLQGKGGWDIYSFYLYPEARPERVLFMKGQLKDEDGKPVSGKVEFKDLRSSKTYRFKVDSATGNYVSALNFDSDYIMTVKKNGYTPTSQLISRSDTTYDKPVKKNITIKAIEVGKSYTLNDIHFATNSYELTDTSKLLLGSLLDFMHDNPTVKISIQGHTDNVNDDQSNRLLSENRAKEVYNYLISNSIDAERLTFKGLGESMPVASNDTQEGRARNRRTEFVVISK